IDIESSDLSHENTEALQSEGEGEAYDDKRYDEGSPQYNPDPESLPRNISSISLSEDD
ncbi:17765_t:CDS:2, partial [Racocetra persica]